MYQDLFFLWDQPFVLYIDSCTHWKPGCRLENKQSPTLLKALMSQWIRVLGPMQTLCSDQEGGLGSAEATVFCEPLGITPLNLNLSTSQPPPLTQPQPLTHSLLREWQCFFKPN